MKSLRMCLSRLYPQQPCKPLGCFQEAQLPTADPPAWHLPMLRQILLKKEVTPTRRSAHSLCTTQLRDTATGKQGCFELNYAIIKSSTQRNGAAHRHVQVRSRHVCYPAVCSQIYQQPSGKEADIPRTVCPRIVRIMVCKREQPTGQHEFQSPCTKALCSSQAMQLSRTSSGA